MFLVPENQNDIVILETAREMTKLESKKMVGSAA